MASACRPARPLRRRLERRERPSCRRLNEWRGPASRTRPDQPGLDEPIRNPVVHVSGDLASVWAEYQVRRDTTVTHCGFDAFHLARRDGRWKILNISDTYQRTGCGPAWPR